MGERGEDSQQRNTGMNRTRIRTEVRTEPQYRELDGIYNAVVVWSTVLYLASSLCMSWVCWLHWA